MFEFSFPIFVFLVVVVVVVFCFVVVVVLTIMAGENTQSQHDPTGKASATTFVKGSIPPPFDNQVKYI